MAKFRDVPSWCRTGRRDSVSLAAFDDHVVPDGILGAPPLARLNGTRKEK
jgi:hypothetical protein